MKVATIVFGLALMISGCLGAEAPSPNAEPSANDSFSSNGEPNQKDFTVSDGYSRPANAPDLGLRLVDCTILSDEISLAAVLFPYEGPEGMNQPHPGNIPLLAIDVLDCSRVITSAGLVSVNETVAFAWHTNVSEPEGAWNGPQHYNRLGLLFESYTASPTMLKILENAGMNPANAEVSLKLAMIPGGDQTVATVQTDRGTLRLVHELEDSLDEPLSNSRIYRFMVGGKLSEFDWFSVHITGDTERSGPIEWIESVGRTAFSPMIGMSQTGKLPSPLGAVIENADWHFIHRGDGIA